MFKRKAICVALLAASAPLFAQTDLTSQINAVNSAITQQKDAEAAAQAARAEKYHQWELQQQRQAAQAAKAAAAARAREQARLDRIAAQRQAQAAKEEQYQDQLRDLSLQQKKLQLQAEQVQVMRENDMIDQKLKRESAETDLVQSRADANRNVSQGAKTLLEDTGKARVKKESGWFH